MDSQISTGTVKRAVWRQILQKRAQINLDEDFSKCAQGACPNISILFLKSEDALSKNATLVMCQIICSNHEAVKQNYF